MPVDKSWIIKESGVLEKLARHVLSMEPQQNRSTRAPWYDSSKTPSDAEMFVVYVRSASLASGERARRRRICSPDMPLPSGNLTMLLLFPFLLV